jgi:hypothetical protein
LAIVDARAGIFLRKYYAYCKKMSFHVSAIFGAQDGGRV